MAGYYDKNKDYSKELQRTDLSSSERAQLTQERQNKIDAQYGGKEPNMTGSNKTYSQIYGGGSSDSGGSSSGRFGNIDYDRSANGGGIYGAPISNSQQKNYTRGGVRYNVGADMSRRPDLAGGYAVSNGYTVFYDKDGYVSRVEKGKADYTPFRDQYAANGYTNKLHTDEEMLTGNDQARIQALRRQAAAGQITWDQANQQANAIRSGYGYTVDKSGLVTDLPALAAVDARRAQWGLPTNPEDILYGLVNNGYNTSDAGKPSFDYSYDSEMRALIDQILNSNLADWKQGDQYAALRDQYAANGEMSMSDLLGQVSSRTGGLASSYAASVANQEYNDWMSKLEQAAQEMYQQDRSDKLNNLGVLNDAYSREYGEYADQLNQWNTDRNFAYQQEQDALSNQWKQKEWDYNMSQDEYNRLAQQADNLAAYGDFSGYKALGYTDSQINQMRQAYQIAQAAKAQSGSRSSGSRSSGSKKSGDDGMKLSVAKDNAKQGIFTQEVLDAFHKNGYSDEYLEKTYGYNNPASASNFDRAYNSLNISLSEESPANAEKNLNKFVQKYWDYLSDAQKKQVTQLASNYGFQM